VILDPQDRYVISHEWVAGGGIVRRDVRTGALSRFAPDGPGYLQLYKVDENRFLAARHAPEHDMLTLSVRRFDDPGSVLWSLVITPNNQKASGDPGAAIEIRRHHVASFKNGGRWSYQLVTVSRDATAATLGALPWFNAKTYDLGYQAPLDAIAFPGNPFVLISVARSSTIVVHDPTEAGDVGRVELAGRMGNPILKLVGNELWTIDYDTFVRVDLSTRQVIASITIQPALHGAPTWSAEGTRQFAGNLFVWSARQRAVIPRPFSGDVLVDPKQRVSVSTLTLGAQPLSCVVTVAGQVIARDWKTGKWLEGQLDDRPT
jgi:hypothetical protein